MSIRPLAGRLILVVEDEPLIALEVDKALRQAGAAVVSAGYVESGLFTTEHPNLAAAVIDLHLGDGSGTAVCRRLRHLGMPFVVHTGYPRMLVEQQWPDVPIICKPARAEHIVDELTRLLYISALHDRPCDGAPSMRARNGQPDRHRRAVTPIQADGVAKDGQMGDGGIDLADAGRTPERHLNCLKRLTR